MRTLREGDPRLKEYVVYISLAANSLLNALNVVWGLKILDGVRKMLSGVERGGGERGGGERGGGESSAADKQK